MSEIIVSVSGVRGVYGSTLTPVAIVKYSSAFGRVVSASKKSLIVIGRDGRIGGELVSNICASVMTMMGYSVMDIGVAPTPTVQLAVENEKAAGGIVITASHNPQEWNGLKFLQSNGTFLSPKDVEKLKKMSETSGDYVPVKIIGMLRSVESYLDYHIKSAFNLKLVNKTAIKKRKFKIVVDAVNSSGSEIIPALLKKLGCKVIPLFCTGSGIFPHTPEPLPQNLKQLSSAVLKHKADMGIAIDPDADRLVIVMDNGKPYGEENTITTAIKYVFKKTKGRKISVVNLSTTRAAEDEAIKAGGLMKKSAVGEINVVELMKKSKAVIGGEGSGGVILPALHYGRDSLAGIVLLLSEFAEAGKKLSEYQKTLPSYYIHKAKIENIKNPQKLLNKIALHFKNLDCKVNLTDGVKLDFPEYWIHLRKSNTEPIVRVIVEARSKQQAKFEFEAFMKEVKRLKV